MLRLNQIQAYYYSSKGVVKAVDNVSLDIQENEILGIAGESGCGKSSLIKVIYGNVEPPLKIVNGTTEARYTGPDGKEVLLNGKEIRKAWWQYISYIPQGSMSVLNPVVRIEPQFFDAVTRSNNQLSKKAVREQVIHYLKELDLPVEVLQAYPHQLSGGMRQRVIVALATFLHPRMILADEPTTALDVVVQRGILTMLTQLQRKMKNTLVIVSHDMGVHYQITTRMAIMYAGKIVELGPTDTIFNRPSHPYPALLIKSLPRIGDHQLREGIPGAPPSLLNPPAGCRFSTRCPFVMDICRSVEPPLVELEPGHLAACHLNHPAAAQPAVNNPQRIGQEETR
jgi:peptide/nickel transport system ATP-binding protein